MEPHEPRRPPGTRLRREFTSRAWYLRAVPGPTARNWPKRRQPRAGQRTSRGSPHVSVHSAVIAQFLTSQPFLPKLRLTKHMRRPSQSIRFWALFLGLVFLAAQFHFCADLTSQPTSSHICPLCNAAGSAIAMNVPSVAVLPLSHRLGNFCLGSRASRDIPRGTSPRAPPSA